MLTKLRNFFQEEDGVTVIEYSLIAALIIVVAIGIITTTGTDVKQLFTMVSDALKGAGA